MKNNNRIIAVFVVASLVLSGCNKELDVAPDGRVSIDEVFADNNMTAAYLNTCYMNIPSKSYGDQDLCVNILTALTDDGYLSYTLQDHVVPKLYANSANAMAHPLRDYTDLYMTYMAQIRLCTIFLKHIDDATVDSETDRSRWKAEAHVLRAYFMSEMLKWFGGFAYESDGYTLDYDYTTLVKKTPWEIAGCIAEECDAAIACDDLPWRITDDKECLRVTKALAWSLKSQAYLFAASLLFNQDEDPEKWDKAYDVNKAAVEALEANGYALKTTVSDSKTFTGPAAAYKELFGSALSSADDPETIWRSNQKMSLGTLSYIHGTNLPNSGNAGICPTQQMVDAYEVTNADRSQAEPLLNLAKPYNSSHLPNYNAKAIALGYKENDPYDCYRDPRMDACIVKNGDIVNWEGKDVAVETYVGGASSIEDNTTIATNTRTGYYYSKWVRPGTDDLNGYAGGYWKYFRLALIKLNYAEAAAETGHLDEARKQVDDIRERAGMPDLPAGLSQEEMIMRVRHERQVELCYEEVRYFDIRRWQDIEDGDLTEICKYNTAMWITKNDDGSFTYTRKPNLMNKSTNNRDLLLPYPYNEAQNLKTLTGKNWQNEGW
jgi:hypothetical protein